MLLDVEDLQLSYSGGGRKTHAVRGVTIRAEKGTTLALVGESGCGKSSTARLIAGLETATAGRIRVAGHPIEEIAARRSLRRLVQMVFQHSDQALDRMWSVERSVGEALRRTTRLTSQQVRQRVVAALADVGLDESYLGRRPKDLSGGQAQRVAIARALVTTPELVVLDEPTASLDQAVRGRILGLLKRLQREHGMSYVFISHDLVSVRNFADRVAVMYLGRIVEEGPTETVFSSPRHPYTQALLAAEPPLTPGTRWDIAPLEGETPSASKIPPGCTFRSRCPIATARCAMVDPPLHQVTDDHTVACIEVAEEA
jgi:oligopeptide/dipeptide ABC transporter ATP-binding protein